MRMTQSKVIQSSSVQGHHDRLLAEHCDWIFGSSFELKVAEPQAQRQSHDRSLFRLMCWAGRKG